VVQDSSNRLTLDESRATIGGSTHAFLGYVATPQSPSVIIIRHEGSELAVSPEELLLGMISYARGPIQPLLSKVIGSLLNNYEFLGHQMNLELGNISEADFALISTKHLQRERINDAQSLRQEIEWLFGLTGSVYTSDQLSLMFNCSILDAERALDLLLEA